MISFISFGFIIFYSINLNKLTRYLNKSDFLILSYKCSSNLLKSISIYFRNLSFLNCCKIRNWYHFVLSVRLLDYQQADNKRLFKAFWWYLQCYQIKMTFWYHHLINYHYSLSKTLKLLNFSSYRTLKHLQFLHQNEYRFSRWYLV